MSRRLDCHINMQFRSGIVVRVLNAAGALYQLNFSERSFVMCHWITRHYNCHTGTRENHAAGIVGRTQQRLVAANRAPAAQKLA